MKTTKKILSLTLAMLMLISCVVFVGCEETLGYFTERKMKSAYIEAFNIQGVDANDVVIDYYAGKYSDLQIAMLDAECHDPATWVETIGGSHITYYDANRLLAWDGETFMTLTEARDEGKLTYDDIASIAAKFNGDVKHFYDTGDVFDYEEKEYTDLPDNFLQSYPMFNSNMLQITFDKKLNSEENIPSAEFFEARLDIKVRSAYTIHSSKDDNITIVIIRFEDDITDVFELIDSPLHSTKSPLYIIHLNKIKKEIEKIPGIKKVELVQGGYTKTPNDTYYSDSNKRWALDYIEIEKVWDFYTGTKLVRVGIVDSGILDHSDLADNVVIGKDFFNNNTVTNDDVEGHGTSVAGVVGATGNNGLGISGVNWRVGLVPLQVDDMVKNGEPNYDSIPGAVKYATDSYLTSSPIKIINLSSCVPDSDDLKEEIESYPGLFVCGSGNANINTDVTHAYPGYYGSELYDDPLENIIVVGALNQSGGRLAGTCYGEKTVDIYAPGANIYTTTNNNGYISDSGTSFAAPYVSGVAALLLSINPDLTTAQLKDCILSGADEIQISVPNGLFSTTTQTVKKLNAWGAFKYMMKNYIPSYRLGTTTTEISLETDRLSSYYLESHPTAKIVIPYSQTFTFSATGAGSKVDAVLYDSNMNPVSISKTWTNNQWTVNFTNELAAGTYYLSTYYTSTGTHDIDVTISHTHEYTGYARYSSQYHVGCCVCGATNSNRSVHVCRASDEDAGDRFYTCILCGAAMDSEMGGPGMIIHAIQKVSVNGSYILSDGTVFLVDEDIDAYFEGTLVFYDPDKLPQVE